jgi:hypothetical protein
MSQYIYLLREREFIKTKENIYKVGRTEKENLKRFNQYPKGSELLFQMICNDCKSIEKKVLKKFNKKFELKEEIGKEYFEGDYKNMIKVIYSIIKKEDNKKEDNKKESEYEEICEKICKIFPDYKNDESFGGSKKYIKINITNDEYVVRYINPRLKDDLKYYNSESESDFDDYIVNRYEMNENVADRLQYFNELLSKKSICLDEIYDINSIKFIHKINKTKFEIKIESYDDFKAHLTDSKNKYAFDIYCKISEKIRRLFHCNTIINGCLHSTLTKEDENDDIFKKLKNLKDFDSFQIDVGIRSYVLITLYKINSKYYDYKTFLRKYIPYVIRWDVNNDYYILNRDYEYIGLNSKCIEYTHKGGAHLFNDGNKPWDNKNDYIRLCNEYNKLVSENSLKECLNMHKSTRTSLKLLY